MAAPRRRRRGPGTLHSAPVRSSPAALRRALCSERCSCGRGAELWALTSAGRGGPRAPTKGAAHRESAPTKRAAAFVCPQGGSSTVRLQARREQCTVRLHPRRMLAHRASTPTKGAAHCALTCALGVQHGRVHSCGCSAVFHALPAAPDLLHTPISQQCMGAAALWVWVHFPAAGAPALLHTWQSHGQETSTGKRRAGIEIGVAEHTLGGSGCCLLYWQLVLSSVSQQLVSVRNALHLSGCK